MKKSLLFIAAALMMVSCAQEELRHPKWAYDATIFELNTRQATEEGHSSLPFARTESTSFG